MSTLKRYWAVQPGVKKHDQSGTLNWVQLIHQDVGLTDYIILCLKRFSSTSEGVLSLFGTQIAAVFLCRHFTLGGGILFPRVTWSQNHLSFE